MVQQTVDVPPIEVVADPQDRLTNLIVTSQTRPFRVSSIRIEGAAHTSSEIISNLVSPVLKSETLGDVIAESREACHRLRRLGVFRNVEVVLDSPLNGKDEVDVVLNVVEGPRFYARQSVDVGNYEGNANLTGRLTNLAGTAETVEINASYGVETTIPLHKKGDEPFGAQTGSAFQFLFSKPVIPTPEYGRPAHTERNARVEVGASKVNRNLSLYASHEEKLHGVLLRYKTQSMWDGNHTFQYGMDWRHIHSLGKDASWSVRQDGGHSLKSAISHTFVRDRRDDSMLPTQGTYVRTAEELAGLGGDVKFIKGEAEGQTSYPLGHGFSFTFSGRSGLILPWGRDRTRISDRFNLGGPLTIRGFRQNGVGPRDGDDSIGGDAYWAAGLSLFTPLPYLVNKPLKGHLFVNAGSLLPVNTAKPLQETLHDAVRAPSISTGLGLAVRFSILRLELNWCLPITATTTDKVKPGLQFGIGLNYM